MAQATIGELLNAGREMRRWQKTFFRSQPGTEKQMALEQSKAWEKIFDALIDPDREKQLEMFEEPDPFPPTTPAPTSDTLGDRLLSTALRERK